MQGLKENVIIGRLIPARLEVSDEGRRRLNWSDLEKKREAVQLRTEQRRMREAELSTSLYQRLPRGDGAPGFDGGIMDSDMSRYEEPTAISGIDSPDGANGQPDDISMIEWTEHHSGTETESPVEFSAPIDATPADTAPDIGRFDDGSEPAANGMPEPKSEPAATADLEADIAPEPKSESAATAAPEADIAPEPKSKPAATAAPEADITPEPKSVAEADAAPDASSTPDPKSDTEEA